MNKFRHISEFHHIVLSSLKEYLSLKSILSIRNILSHRVLEIFWVLGATYWAILVMKVYVITPSLGTIQVLRKHVFGLFSPHPTTL